MGKTIYIDDGDALNIDRVIVNMPNSKWCKVLYSCDLIDEYEARLKADMVAMLEEMDLQFDEICFYKKGEWKTVPEIKAEYKAVIQEKIEQLKGENKT